MSSPLMRLFLCLSPHIPIVSINLCHNENIIPFFPCAVLYHALEICSVVGRTRYCLVDIGVKDKNVMGFGIILAYPQLPLD